MDWFDLIPIVPPSLPGERAPGKTPEQNLAAGVASVVLPTIGFILVLFTGFAFDPVVALLVLPVVAALLAFVAARLVSIPLAWAVVLAIGSGVFCCIADAGALLLHGFAQFFHDF